MIRNLRNRLSEFLEQERIITKICFDPVVFFHQGALLLVKKVAETLVTQNIHSIAWHGPPLPCVITGGQRQRSTSSLNLRAVRVILPQVSRCLPTAYCTFLYKTKDAPQVATKRANPHKHEIKCIGNYFWTTKSGLVRILAKVANISGDSLHLQCGRRECILGKPFINLPIKHACEKWSYYHLEVKICA